MSLLSFFGLNEKRQAQAAPSHESLSHDAEDDDWFKTDPSTGYMYLNQSAAGVFVNEHIAMTYSACWAATRLLCGTGGMLPFNFHRSLTGGGSEILYEHRLHKVLHDEPNDEMSSMTFRASRINHQINCGNCFAEIGRTLGGQVVALYPIHPSRIPFSTNIKRVNGRLLYLVNNDDGSRTEIRQENMFHVPSIITDDGVIGRGVVENARLSIGFGIAAEKHGAAYFGNGARPGIIIKGAKFKKAEDAEEFRRQWVQTHGGPDRHSKPAIIPPDADVTLLPFNAQDSQFLESRQHSIEEIGRWYGVPSHLLNDLRRATFCLPASEPVFTESGPVSIAKVKPGDRVWSWSTDGWKLSAVVRSMCSGTDEILEIKTRNRVLRCNAKHPILVRKKYATPRFGRGGYQCTEWQTEYIPAGKLTTGDIVVLANGMVPDDGQTVAPNGRQLTVQFLEFCGLFIGDGWLNKKSGTVTIARCNRASYMEHYRESMRTLFRRGNRKSHLRTYEDAPITIAEREYSTRFNSKNATEELESLGFSGTAHTKQVPGWVFSLSQDLRLAFLRGYLDADGHVDKNGEIVFRSCNEVLLDGVRHLCIGLGIAVGKIRCHEGVKTLPDGRLFAFRNYCLGLGCVQDNLRIGSHDVRYQERFAANSNRPRKKVGQFRWLKNHTFTLSGCELATISSIDKLPAEPVYDLEVEGTHSFVANGVIVHNSNIEHQGIEFVKYSLMPWLKLWEQEVWRKLLTKDEQKTHYAKFNVDALERGDKASRTAASTQEVFNGLLTINKWAEREDMNPIGPLGDIHWTQQAMVPLEIAAKGPQQTPTDPNAPASPFQPQGDKPADDKPDDVPEPKDDAGLSALREQFDSLQREHDKAMQAQQRIAGAMLRDAMARMLSIEIHSVKHIAEKPNKFDQRLREFYDKHKTTMARSLSEPVAVVLTATGDARQAAEVVELLASLHVTESLRQLNELTTCTGDELFGKVEERLATWHDERASVSV